MRLSARPGSGARAAGRGERAGGLRRCAHAAPAAPAGVPAGDAMNDQLSILRLIMQASVPVQIVIGILLLASLTSWQIIFRKRRVIGRSRREADRFESRFWSGDDLAQLYRSIESAGGAYGMAGIFEFGFREFARLRQANAGQEQQLEGARRAMRVAQLKEVDRLEHSLATLATVGSTSPYV